MKKWFTLAAVAGLAVSAFWFLQKTGPGAPETPAPAKATPGQQAALPEMPPPSPAAAVQTPYTPRDPAAWEAAAAQLATIGARIPDSGTQRKFVLAVDEVYTRSGGAGALASLPGSGVSSYLQGIRTATPAAEATQPVLYEAGMPRSESTRRVVTRKVLIGAPNREEAEKIAASKGLSFRSAPHYAPGLFVFEAESAWDVLPLIAENASAESPGLQPILAAHRAKRTNPNDALFANEWHLRFQNQGRVVPMASANVAPVWGYAGGPAIRGRGIVIGIVDDGVDAHHPDLAPNMDTHLGWDWIDGDNNPEPGAGDSHGTAVAGNAAASGNNTIGVTGSAPEATLVGLRLIGGALIDDLEESEALSHANNRIHVKNNSWGPDDSGTGVQGPGPLTAAALADAATNGRQGRGTILAWAAGNGRQSQDNSNFDGYANSIHAIAVGASDANARQAPYSESGANLAVCAPSGGDSRVPGITTTDLRGTKGYNFGGLSDYRNFLDYTNQFSGTSSATPTVAGIIALMLQANPALGHRDVKEILMLTAARIHPEDNGWARNAAGFNFNHRYGAGRVDGAAAVAAAQSWKNLPAPASATSTVPAIVPIPDNDPAGATHTHTINAATDIRVEHATLRVQIPSTPKGDLTITLTSPSGTRSVFSEPHSDRGSVFGNWTFSTVRCWGEPANGNWTVQVADSVLGGSGDLEGSTLTIHGSSMGDFDPPPFVEVASPRPGAALRPPIAITVNATDFTSTNATIPVARVDLLVNGVVVDSDTSPPFTFTFNATGFRPGPLTLEAQAFDADGLGSASQPVEFFLLPNTLVAGWDFETHTANRSATPLPTALQGPRSYRANFSSGNATMLLDGTGGSSTWEVANGEIWSGTGTALNADQSFSQNTSTTSGLMVRGGRNLSANGKSIVFRFGMAGSRRLIASYAAFRSPRGFQTHRWESSTDGLAWTPLRDFTVTTDYQRFEIPAIPALTNAPNAFLRLTFLGAGADHEFNHLDNFVFSATR